MKKTIRCYILLSIATILFMSGCSSNTNSAIERYPEAAANFELEMMKQFDIDALMNDKAGINLVGCDFSKYDLNKYQKKLEIASFDTLTKWPTKLPKGFSPNKLMELGKDPGINIKDLHSQGINGENIGIAIIDGPILIEHEEYAKRIKLYREHNIYNNPIASYHGTAVTSIAVGANLGVAPEANIYYIAEGNMTSAPALTKDIYEIIKINKSLPADEKIKVISISIGIADDQENYNDFIEAIEKAKEENIIVLSATENSYFFEYFDIGLDRKKYADPNDISSFLPSHHRLTELYNYIDPDVYNTYLLVPMEARTVASHTGKDEYRYEAVAGVSLSIPYVAGLYALCCQVDYELSYDSFIEKATATSIPIFIEHDKTIYNYGRILQPKELIAAIKNSK